ncbi:MAG: enoyl-CoA hydratase-related protein, partial [Quisquiliibacterium sp.]
EHAFRIGLVNRIHPAEKLLEASIDYAQKLASRAPLPQRFAKEVMRRAIGMGLDEALWTESRSFHDVGMTQDLAEGTDAFRQRRVADLHGR